MARMATMHESASSSSVEITPVSGPIDAVVAVPGSKSITNRALLIAALAAGRTTLRGALHSDDTCHMAGALRALGIAVEEDAGGARFVVDGRGGSALPPPIP